MPPPKEIISRVEALGSRAGRLLSFPAAAGAWAVDAHEAERDRIVQQQLAGTPLSALKEAAGGRLRFGAIESAGLRTVADIRAANHRRLESIRGVGPQTSARVITAALQVEEAVRGAVRVRFDVDSRPPEQTVLLQMLRALDASRRNIGPLSSRLEELKRAVEADLRPARLEYRRIRRFFASRRRKEAGRAAFDRLASLLHSPAAAALRAEMDEVEKQLSVLMEGQLGVWGDYTAKPVLYNGLLVEVSGLHGSYDSPSRGYVPREIVERIRGFDLDQSLLDEGLSLRGYQSFGAKFALVQERTILGDEMGLGKTIEALAVLCHLRSHGASRLLVVCPASVLVNWEQEIIRHTKLRCVRLHGSDRHLRLRRWVRGGGAAVTTFDTLRSLELPNLDE